MCFPVLQVGVLLLLSWLLVFLCTLAIFVIAVSDPIENYEVANLYAERCYNNTFSEGDSSLLEFALVTHVQRTLMHNA